MGWDEVASLVTTVDGHRVRLITQADTHYNLRYAVSVGISVIGHLRRDGKGWFVEGVAGRHITRADAIRDLITNHNA